MKGKAVLWLGGKVGDSTPNCINIVHKMGVFTRATLGFLRLLLEQTEEAEETTEGEGQTRYTALCDRLCLHEALCDACIMFECVSLFSFPLLFSLCVCVCVCVYVCMCVSKRTERLCVPELCVRCSAAEVLRGQKCANKEVVSGP